MGDDLIPDMNSSGKTDSLRLITYQAPSIPVEFYTLLGQYLESKLKCHVYMMVESRSEGPLTDRPDPFTQNEADVGILSSSSLKDTLEKAKGHAVLLPVAPVYAHHGSNGRPVYFSDVIIHKDNREKYKEFRLLHGAKWAFSSVSSVSSYLRPLFELKRMGQNANFFTKVVESGSHNNSISMILNKTVDGAAVDSVALSMQKTMRADVKDNIFVLTSWGPIAVHPIVVNTRLPKDFREKLSQCLLDIQRDNEWNSQFHKFSLIKFVPVSEMDYLEDEQMIKKISGMRLEGAVYY